ncbi:MAG: carbohydrate-binding family 9-like protein [Sphaerochaeta sp.]|nr:carbohydrate-binding family 9-like protein [Sphaerochaeta sp.]
MEEEKVIHVFQGDLDHALPLALQSFWGEAESIEVSSRLSYSQQFLHVRFSVMEKQLRRMTTEHNQQTYTDSCVEIFLKSENQTEYVNFEFSASTKVLVGRGEGRGNRTLYPISLIKQIPVSVQILENCIERSIWKLEASIDLSLFGLVEPNTSLSGLRLMGNLYKCGDGLKEKHYLSYAPVGTLKPDFHTPSFFVPLQFS